jgi:CheY-like chemotaxis protein
MNTRPWRIWLAEDNDADAMLIEEALRRKSLAFEIAHYRTAHQAISEMEAACLQGTPAPDLILLDYNLPGGQGLDILAAARNNPGLSQVPKVIITSFLQPHELEQATQLGACGVIAKPSGLHEFFSQVGAKIEELLESGSIQSGGSPGKRFPSVEPNCSSRTAGSLPRRKPSETPPGELP